MICLRTMIYLLKENNMQKIENSLRSSAELTKALLESKMSDSLALTITTILKEGRTQGREQYTVLRQTITDILNNSNTEQEIMQKLHQKFPK